MQSACSAEGEQGIVAGIDPTRHGNAADGAGHTLVGYLLEAAQEVFLLIEIARSGLYLLPYDFQCLLRPVLENGNAHSGRL